MIIGIAGTRRITQQGPGDVNWLNNYPRASPSSPSSPPLLGHLPGVPGATGAPAPPAPAPTPSHGHDNLRTDTRTAPSPPVVLDDASFGPRTPPRPSVKHHSDGAPVGSETRHSALYSTEDWDVEEELE